MAGWSSSGEAGRGDQAARRWRFRPPVLPGRLSADLRGGAVLLVLVWAGARGWDGRLNHRISFKAAWATASHLSLGEVVVLVLAVTLLPWSCSPCSAP